MHELFAERFETFISIFRTWDRFFRVFQVSKNFPTCFHKVSLTKYKKKKFFEEKCLLIVARFVGSRQIVPLTANSLKYEISADAYGAPIRGQRPTGVPARGVRTP